MAKTSATSKKVPDSAGKEKLQAYISQAVRERKDALRKSYQQEIEAFGEKLIQFVIITVGNEQYAIDIETVKEVVPFPELTKAPNTQAHVKGLANVRGITHLVVDLQEKLQMGSTGQASFLVVLESAQFNASIMLEELPSTLKCNGKDISSSLEMMEDASIDVTYIKGIIKQDDQLIFYLDIYELLNSDKAIVVPDELLGK